MQINLSPLSPRPIKGPSSLPALLPAPPSLTNEPLDRWQPSPEITSNPALTLEPKEPLSELPAPPLAVALSPAPAPAPRPAVETPAKPAAAPALLAFDPQGLVEAGPLAPSKNSLSLLPSEGFILRADPGSPSQSHIILGAKGRSKSAAKSKKEKTPPETPQQKALAQEREQRQKLEVEEIRTRMEVERQLQEAKRQIIWADLRTELQRLWQEASLRRQKSMAEQHKNWQKVFLGA